MPRSRLVVSAAELETGRVAVALLVGLVGVLVALALPFAPAITQQTAVVWPVPGRPVVSSTVLFAPYRPAELTATVPCSALRSAAEQDHVVTVLATGPPGEGMVLRAEAGAAQLQLGRRVVSSTPLTRTGSDCWMRLHSGPAGTVITIGATRTINLADEPVPQVFAFHTDLQPWQAVGMTVTARTASPFATSPSGADRVRIQAIDATTDPDGWLAVTGPRLRSVAGLSTFVASHGPVLVNWPQAFLFPCVHNIVGIADGLVDTPCAIIEAPRRYGLLAAVITDQAMGGNFAALSPYGHLYEVPTRLTGHPEIDWGALQLSADPAALGLRDRHPGGRRGGRHPGSMRSPTARGSGTTGVWSTTTRTGWCGLGRNSSRPPCESSSSCWARVAPPTRLRAGPAR